MYKAVNEFCTGWLHGNFYLVRGMKIWWGSLLGWIFRVQINFVQCCQENLPTIYPSLALSCVFKEENFYSKKFPQTIGQQIPHSN